jgi:hypothetical protein
MNNFTLPENRYKLNLPLLKNFDYQKLEQNEIESARKTTPFDNETTVIEMQPTNKELTSLRQNIMETFQKEHFFWDVEPPSNYYNDLYYRWDLPPSKFNEESEINKVDLEVYTFQSDRKKLNPQQIKDIWQTRTFTVNSEIPHLPHKWELSRFLLNSSQEKNHFLKKTLAFCWSILFAIVNVLNPCSSRVWRYKSCISIQKPNLFNVLVSIWAFFLNLLDLLVGIKFRTFKFNYKDEVRQNMVKKQFLKIKERENDLPETCSLLEYLLIPEVAPNTDINKAENAKLKKKREKILQFNKELLSASSKFEELYKKELNEALNKEDYEEEELQLIRQEFANKKQEKLGKFLMENKDKFKNEHIMDLIIRKLECHSLFSDLSSELNKARKQIIADQNKQVEEQFPIYSLIDYKKKNLTEKKIKEQMDFKEAELYHKFKETLAERNRPEEVLLTEFFRSYLQEEDKLFKKELRLYRKNNLKCSNVLTNFTRLYPCCYKIEKLGTPERPHYTLIKKKKVEFKSRYLGYRVVYGIHGYFLYLNNTIYHLLRWFWDGPLGLRLLITCQDFWRNETIDYETGDFVRYKNLRVRPVLRKFTAILKGMQIYKQKFEERPDNGLFGKNMGRFCLYLECIIIRFLVVGVLLILIINPLLILINLIITLLLIITCPILVLLWQVICFLFKVLVFDYHSTFSKYSHIRRSTDKNMFENINLQLIQSYQCMPIINFIIDIFFQIILQSILVVLTLTLGPLLSIIILVGGVTLYVIKNIWDWFILNVIIKCCARVPSGDTNYAVRVSGPGVSRDFYNSLESQHLSLLVIAHLEKCELDQIRTEVNEILESPKHYISQKYEILFKHFSLYPRQSIYFNKSYSNLAYLKQSLDHHIQKRKNMLPVINSGKHTVRFTEEDLEKNQLIVQGILSEVIEEKNMDYYIWKKYNLRKGLFKRLTREVLKDVLTNDALEAVEKVDQVQRLQYSKNSINTYVNQLVMDEENSYNIKRKKKLQMIQTMRVNAAGNPSSYTNLSSLTTFFSSINYSYNHPFMYFPIQQKSVKNWEKEENK